MAKKIKIDIDFSQDNILMAISCHKKDYWLAYQLNEKLQLNLKKIDDFGFYQSKIEKIIPYPIYYYLDTVSTVSWYLIGNYHPDGKLFPTLKTTDFFMLLNGETSIHSTEQLTSQIKKINGVLHAYMPDIKSLKEYGNFLSDLELHMIDSLKK